METVPVKPQAPVHRPARAQAPRRPPGGARAPAAHAEHVAAPHSGGTRGAGAAPATPNDFATLQRQSAFDAIASARAEAQREMNILRDLAMQQVKRDDMTVGAWIKLI